MATKKPYVRLIINGIEADLDPDTAVPTIDYILEDDQDFEQKGAAASFDISLPATQNNDRIHNTLHDPGIVDTTKDGSFDNYRPAVYIGQGQELLIGKYLPLTVTMKNGKPVKYTGKIYGQNGDWTIALKDATLAQFLNPLSHTYEQGTVQNSWAFDGYNQNLDFVYAPVRYQKPFGAYPVPSDPPADTDPTNPDDLNMILEDFRPSIFIYWILFRGFKFAGYKIKSNFLDSQYFRRMAMPWTWGGFNLLDDTRWQTLKFLAATKTPPLAWLNDTDPPRAANQQDLSVESSDVRGAKLQPNYVREQGAFDGYPPLFLVDDGSQPGTFDNSGTFQYLGAGDTMPYAFVWKYPTTSNLGVVYAGLSVQLNYGYYITENSDIIIAVEWYLNGVQMQQEDFLNSQAPIFGSFGQYGIPEMKESFFEQKVQPGDVIACRVKLHLFQSTLGDATVQLNVEQFALNYLKIGPGSTVQLKNYPKFSEYKWLDLLRGVIDCFDLSINTHPIRKEVIIEPTHAYRTPLDSVDQAGYYNRKTLDFDGKLDLASEQTLELFSDYGREVDFAFIDDQQDGLLKKIQDRNTTVLGRGKYVLPARYQTDQKDRTNRFFAACVHYVHTVWSGITGKAPQLIVMIPENVSNTSAPAAESVFTPKIAYYKGNVSGLGFSAFGAKLTNFPFLFGVNYLPGGQNDPCLSYCDQFIGGVFTQGLLRKFFLQRMAIYRGGRRWNQAFFRLNNNDMGNFYHRESIIVDGLEYVIIQINGFDPTGDNSTGVTAWLFTPKTPLDDAAVFPSKGSVATGALVNSIYEEKYYQQLALISDIPNYNKP